MKWHVLWSIIHPRKIYSVKYNCYTTTKLHPSFSAISQLTCPETIVIQHVQSLQHAPALPVTVRSSAFHLMISGPSTVSSAMLSAVSSLASHCSTRHLAGVFPWRRAAAGPGFSALVVIIRGSNIIKIVEVPEPSNSSCYSTFSFITQYHCEKEWFFIPKSSFYT